ncbi:hypothetical protein [Pseudochryseolinea flava]|uniref:hypothetical protein n=1 Tax=Pseudochryseolinea flava TaxID=2059302 RepID=UPI0014036F1C|nr:hypothetical protein [Pseudochryseolinea flava]
MKTKYAILSIMGIIAIATLSFTISSPQKSRIPKDDNGSITSQSVGGLELEDSFQ